MGKTPYSLILTDEVVTMVDAIATREGYSRSAMVDQILAEHVRYVTPDKSNREVIDSLCEMLDDYGLRQVARTRSSLTMRTALPFKYNPAVSYAVDLNAGGGPLGRLRVQVRTQNSEVLDALGQFSSLWQTLEEGHLGAPQNGPQSPAAGTAFQRSFRRPAGTDSLQTGRWVGRYVCLIDECLKAFFSLGGDEAAGQRTEQHFEERLETFGGAIKI
jgi:hypothetical protein